MSPDLAVSDRQRRARLQRRHALSEPLGSASEVARALVCLHATEPASVHLAIAARSGLTREDVDRALYRERGLVKQLAMRRTLFAFPRELLPAVWGSASRRVAGQQRTRLAKEVTTLGIATDGAAWLAEVDAQVLAALGDGPATSTELRQRIPELEHRFEGWQGSTGPIAGRVLTVLAAEARIVRGDNELGWRQARHRWTLTENWLGAPAEMLEPAEGYRLLIGAWLARFGPGTEDDIVWWLGATKTSVRRALRELDAVEVALDAGGAGWLLPDDVDAAEDLRPSAALLPALDPTLMGWKGRDFYLDPADVPHLFDSNGNGGATAWWDGFVVGCWVQDADAVIRVLLRRDPGVGARRALDREAARLTEWLRGDTVNSIYASAMQRGARLP